MKSEQILAQKSRILLDNQLSAYDSNNSKAGTFITVSSLFIPISFSFFSEFHGDLLFMILFFLPVIINLLGIYFLLKAMYPNTLYNGISFKEFDRLSSQSPEYIELFEVGINRDCFNGNAPILKKQNQNLRKGLKLIYSSALVLSILFFINLSYNKINNMSDNKNSNTGNNNASGNGNQDSSNNPARIPSTDPGQRSTIEKGGTSKGDNLKK